MKKETNTLLRDPDCSWVSCVARTGWLLQHTSWGHPRLCLGGAGKGLLLWELVPEPGQDAGTWALAHGHCESLLTWGFVCTLGEWLVLPYEPSYQPGFSGVVLVETGPPRSFLEATLLDRTYLTVEQIKNCCALRTLFLVGKSE